MQILSSDGNLRGKMSKVSRSMITSRFDQKDVWQATLEMYIELMR